MTEKTKQPLTKRARRKLGANPSQAWPQMPKVQTPAGRANAYLRVAGLSTKVKAAPLDPALDLMNSPEIKFGRLLASPEQRVRHEAVRRLSQYLKERCVIDGGVGLSELDLLKLWKGLWHTLYMADRVPVQDELSKHLVKLIWCVAGTEEEDEYAGKTYLDMYDGDEDNDDDDDDHADGCVVIEELVNTTGKVYADVEDAANDSESDEGEQEEDNSEEEEDEMDDNLIPHCRGAHLAALFVKTFFQTVRREWGHMDKYRVDKFYTLIRLIMEQVYEYMAKRHWNLGIVRLFNDTIYEEILSQTPNGLSLHLIDLTLEELAKVNAKAPMSLTEATFLDVMEPYFAMSQMCAERIVQARVVEKILHGFLDNYSVVSAAANDGDDTMADADEEDDSLIMDQVHVGTVADFIFQLASDGVTKDEYRESLYETYKKYQRGLKRVDGKDVDIDPEENEAFDEGEQVRVLEVDDPMNPSDEIDAIEEQSKKGNSASKKRKQVEEEPTSVKKGSTKKKSKKANLEVPPSPSVEATAESKEEQIVVTSSKKDKKKRKKAKKAAKEESVITISVADQKRAKEQAVEEEEESPEKPTKKKKKKNTELDTGVSTPNRRVSFGKVNYTKSHKASMKALKTTEPPKPESATPDKSILRKKSPKSSSSKSKGKKGKKAVDYF